MLTVGIDVGGTSVHAGVIADSGDVLETARSDTPPEPQSLEDTIVELIGQLGRRRAVAAAGLAVAGFVTEDQRTVMYAPHLAWRGAPVPERIANRVGVPVILEHDANAAVLAEHRYGAARGAGVVALVSLGTGIGAGLLLDGALFRGAWGVAPELGHVRVVPEGRPCSCGKRGCWERYCSGTGLVTTAVELLGRHPGRSTVLARECEWDAASLTGRRVAEAAREGDVVAQRAMAELARWLGEGFALVADVYDPDIIVLAGGVSESAALFLDDAREHYGRALTGAAHRPLAEIRTAELGVEAGMVGAGVLAREAATVGFRDSTPS